MNPSSLFYSTFLTAAGEFSAAVDDAGAVVLTAFGGPERFERMDRTLIRDDRKAARVRRQIDEYLGGTRRAFDLVLRPEGTPFQQRVWTQLGKIPYGETRNYGEIARAVGSSARAVGGAVGSNPLCPIIPCHRVIGADGSLTGFGFGLALKRRLLGIESPVSAPLGI